MAEDGRMVDWQDPSEILMQKEEEALLIPFPVNGEITHELLMAIGDMASEYPMKWRTLRAKNAFPEYTIDRLAAILGINRKTVMKHLEPFPLEIKDKTGMVIKIEIIGGKSK